MYAFSSREVICSQRHKIKIAVVVPAIKELENIQILLTSLKENDNMLFNRTMILFVINNLKSSNVEIKVENKETMKFLKRIIDKCPADKIENDVIRSGLSVAYIDAATEENELKEKHGGVGLARKIGMDAVLNFFDYKTAGKNTIVCLDADCTVERNYLSKIYSEFSNKNYSVGYVNFKHLLPENNEQQQAIINYEIFLRYYVLGLKFAESPFAFHTIGSTMICDADSYVKVGGMNKRKAAEDFYFMGKLAKVTPIYKIKDTTVYPSGRSSWRVPFGTGQRVNRFLKHLQNEYLLYSPASFFILKKWLKIYHSKKEFFPSVVLENAKAVSEQLHKFLEANNFISDWEKILKNTKSENQLNKQKIMWFDGFKTLKLIHYLRDNCCPLDNMFDAVEALFEQMNLTPLNSKRAKGEVPDLNTQLYYLNKLREFT